MFKALESSLELVESIRMAARRIDHEDPKLADQLRRAASSISLNLAEGGRRTGKDRRYHFKVAAGSTEETRTCLRLAIAWGHIDAGKVEDALRRTDELQRMLWSLTGAAHRERT